MEKIKKFIQILEKVTPENVYSLGLVINKTNKIIMWDKLINKRADILINGKSDYLDILRKIKKALDNGEWVVLEIEDGLPSRVFAQLKQLSLNNHMQINDDNAIIEGLQSDSSRIIVTGKKEAINQVKKDYPQFLNIFGPVITI